MAIGSSSTAILTRLGRALSIVSVVMILVIGGLGNVGQHAPPGELSDVGSFLHAGALARAGKNPYGAYAHGTNLNAPLSVLPFEWAAQFSPGTVYTDLYFLSLCLYIVVLLLLWRRYPQSHTVAHVVWAVVWGSLWSSLWDGQIYIILTLVATGAWLLMDKRQPVAAGLLIGLLCAIKPNYLVWPTLLAITGAWSVVFATAITVIVLGTIPAIVFGPAIYKQWFVAAAQVSNAMQPANASLPGALARIHAPVWSGLGVSALLLLVLAYWAWRRKPNPAQVSGVGLVAAILASPLGWVDYTLLLLPAFWSRRWTWPWWCAALLLVQFVGNTWWMLKAPAWVLASVGQYGTVAVLLVLIGLVRLPQRQPRLPAAERQHESLSFAPQAAPEAP